MKAKIVFHVGAVIVLAAVVAAAQSPKDKSKPGQPATSQDRQYSAPSVSERETGSGMATGKRQHQPVVISHEMAVDSTSTGHGPAQTATYESGVTTARETGSGMATGRRSGSVIIMNDDSDIAARDAASGMATGKRVSGDPHENLNSRNSAHATESLDVDSKHKGNMSNVQSNPMYKDRGMQGTNPLYEGKDRTAAPPSSNGSQPAQYKDGEDGTTHTRPGNHKPGTVK